METTSGDKRDFRVFNVSRGFGQLCHSRVCKALFLLQIYNQLQGAKDTIQGELLYQKAEEEV